ncbi:hypothetical protein QQP08_007064 [Theobroma cacao]|nr:hypothetical protein QQP08_007064 [Theobroma cacao]
MASGEGRRHRHDLVPLAALISREMKNEKMEKPTVRYGHAAQSRKGEDYFLIKTDCQRVPGNPSSTFSVFAEALRTRGLKDDTTCIVVDIIPPDNSIQPLPPPKKQNKLRALLFRKRSRDSANKLSKKLSAVGIVEELFEEGSAMLAERLGLDFFR